MWRGIIVTLAAAFISIGQAWAIPVDVSTAGVLNCPGGCQAGSTLTASRDIAGAPALVSVTLVTVSVFVNPLDVNSVPAKVKPVP